MSTHGSYAPPVPEGRLLRRPARGGAPRHRLICFHHAGGGAGTYFPWLERVGPDVEVCAVRLPGRESRLDEAPPTDPRQVVDELAATVASLAADGLPMALYGHSMGAVLAYEVYGALRARGLPEPLCLALGAAPAPRLHAEHPPMLPPGHTREDLVAILRGYGGTPPEVFEHPELLDMVLRVLAADFSLLDTYRPADPPATVHCPLVVFAGAGDPMVRPHEVAAWREYAAGPFEHHLLDAGHLFVESHAAELLDRIAHWSAAGAGTDDGARSAPGGEEPHHG
ncbi:thioesterase II family protein [Streptomyces sp. S186]|uniref:thioesterase II family protein n=1 Tax=Streptomyces sp. S186 TaxID=3434395 RepID=UPI003F667A36